MKKILSILILCLVINNTSAQTNDKDFQSDPKLVLEEVFKAARSQDFSMLHLLCPPDKRNDGDTQKYICDIASTSEQDKREFINYFKDARITGEVRYLKSSGGEEIGEIPFWFNHPSGESRSNETMELIKIDGKWYLFSF